MFYYLIHNSSLINNENKNVNILVYGSILYILTHGILSISDKLKKLTFYFWIVFILDCSSIYLLFKNENNGKVNIITQKKNINNNNNLNMKNNLLLDDLKNNIDDLKKNIDKNNNKLHNDNSYTINSAPKKKLKIKDNIQKNNVKFETENKEDLKREIQLSKIENSVLKNLNKNNIKDYDTNDEDDLGTDIDIESFEQTLT